MILRGVAATQFGGICSEGGAGLGYTTGLGVGTSIVTTIQPDTSGIPRPSEIWAHPSGSSSRLFETGTYAYDGAGNILSMTSGSSDSYGYDARSRLTSATLTLSRRDA